MFPRRALVSCTFISFYDHVNRKTICTFQLGIKLVPGTFVSTQKWMSFFLIGGEMGLRLCRRGRVPRGLYSITSCFSHNLSTAESINFARPRHGVHQSHTGLTFRNYSFNFYIPFFGHISEHSRQSGKLGSVAPDSITPKCCMRNDILTKNRAPFWLSPGLA